MLAGVGIYHVDDEILSSTGDFAADAAATAAITAAEAAVSHLSTQ